MPGCGHILARPGIPCPKCGAVAPTGPTHPEYIRTQTAEEIEGRTESHPENVNDSNATLASSFQARVRPAPPTPEEAYAATRVRDRRKALDKFSEFVKQAWNKIPHLADTKLEWNWHHDALCLHLQTMAEEWALAKDNPTQAEALQRIRNLLINIAPGTTKTLITLVFFPAWMWTRYPRWTVRTVSSNPRTIQDSSDFSRQLVTCDWYIGMFIPTHANTCRNPEHGKCKADCSDRLPSWATKRGLLPWAVRDDKNAVSDWGNTLGGSRRSTGLQAAITGEHTDWILCFRGDTLVRTEHGEVPIEQIGQMNPLPKVWSYNTRTGQTELKQVTKWQHTGKKKTVTVRTSTGEVLHCTDDHPIWTSNRGYVEAGALVPELQLTDASIQPRSAKTSRGMYECLPCVRDLFEVLHPGCGRARQAGPTGAEVRSVLFDEVPTHHSNGTSTNYCMRLVPASNQPWIEQGLARVLFEAMLGKVASEPTYQQVPTEGMSVLSDDDDDYVSAEDVLFEQMQERVPLQGNARSGELELLGQTEEHVPRWTLGQHGPIDSRARWLSLYGLQEHEEGPLASGASYRRERDEQPTGEPDHLVRFVPRDPSQVEQSTVLSTGFEPEDGGDSPVDVYDITVEGNHNFFANGILVHNCDDPHDAEKVNSLEERANVISKWDDAIFNRVNDRRVACRVVVMQRLRFDDLAGHIIERDLTGKRQIWCLLVIASEFDPTYTFTTPIGWSDPRKDPIFFAACEGLLDPVRFPKSGLEEELKRLTPKGYAAQHGQNPDSDTTTSFPIGWWSWFRFCDSKIPLSWERPKDAKMDLAYELGRNKHDGSYDLDWVAVSVDASGGSIEEGASQVGILIVGGKKDERFVLDDCTPGVRNFNDQVLDVKKAVERAVRLTGKRTIRVLVEKKAYGGAVLETMEKEVKSGDFGTVDGRPVALFFEPYDIKTTMGSKEQRALALEPDLFAGHVYLPEGAAWLQPFLAEFKRFPAEPNDRVDALVQIVERYRKRITWAQAFKKVGK